MIELDGQLKELQMYLQELGFEVEYSKREMCLIVRHSVKCKSRIAQREDTIGLNTWINLSHPTEVQASWGKKRYKIIDLKDPRSIQQIVDYLKVESEATSDQ